MAFELTELKALDFDLSLTGFDPVQIDAFLVDESKQQLADVIPEFPRNPVSRPGDRWRLDAESCVAAQRRQSA